MAGSDTVIAALKFQGGVLIAADSQVSDPMNQVRWLMQKPQQVGTHPLVAAFSGSKGQGVKAQEALAGCDFRTTTFARRDRVESQAINALKPVYAAIATQSKPPAGASNVWDIALVGLAVYFAEGDGHILEFILNGDTEYHDCFQVIGSGQNTAYAVYETLGGKRLNQLDEERAIWALVRILRTGIKVELGGVSEPIVLYVVTDGKARRVEPDEMQTYRQAVAAWESKERERFFAGEI